MKTIEERAIRASERYKQDIVRFKIPTFPLAYEDGYKAGANEQHKIDIENACEAYCNVVCQAEKKSSKRCYWRVQNERCPELESFVKVMEGEE